MSGAEQGEIMKIEIDSDLVKIGEGGEEARGREGSNSGSDVNQNVSMTMGPVCEVAVNGDVNWPVGPKGHELDTVAREVTGDVPEQTVGEFVRAASPHTL